MLSSWKLLTSTTCSVSGVEASTCALSASPMLPPTATREPPSPSIRPMSVVVVDFPFVPVTAIRRPFSHREASSSSPITGTPFARACSISGCRQDTPGLSTMRSAPESDSTSCPPSSSATPAASNSSAASICGFMSVSTTLAPRRASRCAAATPLRAAPTTTTRSPATLNPSISLPQLQRRQAEERAQDAHDQKASDHLRLTPSDQLEVVVQGGHLEDTLAGQLE